MKVKILIKFSYCFLVTISILILGGGFFFLYENFYQTMVQAKIVYVLKNQVAFDTIDINLWEKVSKNHQQKTYSELEKINELVDPFIGFKAVEEKNINIEEKEDQD